MTMQPLGAPRHCAVGFSGEKAADSLRWGKMLALLPAAGPTMPGSHRPQPLHRDADRKLHGPTPFADVIFAF